MLAIFSALVILFLWGELSRTSSFSQPELSQHVLSNLQPELCPSQPKPIYPRLINSSTMFRFISLHPTRASNPADPDQIHCTLYETFLFDRWPMTDYNVIIHSSGNSTKEKNIMVNHTPFAIHESLWMALIRVRDPVKYTWLWIDAICIDEMNPEEKRQQEPLQDGIFYHAESVSVLLGLHKVSPEVRRAMEAVALCRNTHVCSNKQLVKQMVQPLVDVLIDHEYWDSDTFDLIALAMTPKLLICYGVLQTEEDCIDWNYFFELAANTGRAHKLIYMNVVREKKPTSLAINPLTGWKDIKSPGCPERALGQSWNCSEDRVCAKQAEAYAAMDDSRITLTTPSHPANLLGGHKHFVKYVDELAIDHITKQIEIMHMNAMWRRIQTLNVGKLPNGKEDVSQVYAEFSWRSYLNGLGYAGSMLARYLLEYGHDESGFRGHLSVPGLNERYYYPSCRENVTLWKIDEEPGPNMLDLDDIKVRGRITTCITVIGTQLTDLESMAGFRIWEDFMGWFCLAPFQCKKEERLFDRLPKIIVRNANIMDIMAYETHPGPHNKLHRVVADKLGPDHYKIPSPLVFLGTDRRAIGLVPPAARRGDLIVQFWNSSAAAVVRRENSGYFGGNGFFRIIGRAGVITQGEGGWAWDVPQDRESFRDVSKKIDLVLDQRMLIRLSWNTVFLPPWGLEFVEEERRSQESYTIWSRVKHALQFHG